MRPSQSVAEIAADVASRGVPALFIDACGALEVVRCAQRRAADVAAITRQVIDATAAGELLLYGPSVLAEEVARNRVEVETKAKISARETDESIYAYLRAANTVGRGYPHSSTFNHESLVAPLMLLHDELLATCVGVTTDPTIESIALKRAGKRRAPGRQGGGANDCLLFEEFRAIARAAPAADPLILLTLNTNDFAADKASKGRVHPDLVADLEGTKGQICLSWPHSAVLVLSQDRRDRIWPWRRAL